MRGDVDDHVTGAPGPDSIAVFVTANDDGRTGWEFVAILLTSSADLSETNLRPPRHQEVARAQRR
jgi:hypothetical protein